jgi:hypothetical protein
MTSVDLQFHWNRRKERALSFVAHPEVYKVCDQCWSISKRGARVCPICGAWRWDRTPERVIEISRLMAKNPFPVTAGVVPRLSNGSV